jgi:choline dehydrogenase-like flavoprotein
MQPASALSPGLPERIETALDQAGGSADDPRFDSNSRPNGSQYAESGAEFNQSHDQGGTIMAASPDRGVVNAYLPHWQMPNLFVLAGSTFPNQGAANPTLTVLAFTYRAADAIVDRCLKRPGMLP